MGQKSLSSLHRIDSSMIWSSYIHDKRFKWLSYNLWFAYIQFYKVIFFFNYEKSKFRRNVFCCFSKNFLSSKLVNYKHPSKTNLRFCYYIDLYCVEIFNFLLLLNLYFFTTLAFYKKKKKKISMKKLNNFF